MLASCILISIQDNQSVTVPLWSPLPTSLLNVFIRQIRHTSISERNIRWQMSRLSHGARCSPVALQAAPRITFTKLTSKVFQQDILHGNLYLFARALAWKRLVSLAAALLSREPLHLSVAAWRMPFWNTDIEEQRQQFWTHWRSMRSATSLATIMDAVKLVQMPWWILLDWIRQPSGGIKGHICGWDLQ